MWSLLHSFGFSNNLHSALYLKKLSFKTRGVEDSTPVRSCYLGSQRPVTGLVLVLRGPEQWASCLCLCSHSPVPALSWCPVPLCLGLTSLLLFSLACPGSLRVSNAPSSFPQPLRPGGLFPRLHSAGVVTSTYLCHLPCLMSGQMTRWRLCSLRRWRCWERLCRGPAVPGALAGPGLAV